MIVYSNICIGKTGKMRSYCCVGLQIEYTWILDNGSVPCREIFNLIGSMEIELDFFKIRMKSKFSKFS